MPDHNLTLEPRLVFALESLGVALHVPEDLSGIASTLSAAINFLHLAANHFDEPNLFEWKSVANDLLSAISEQAAAGSPHAARWYRPPTTDGSTQSRLESWRCPANPRELERKLCILIGRSIAAAAAQQTRINSALIEGANILRNTQRGKGRRSHAWNIVLPLDLLDRTSIAHLCESTDPRDAHFSFVLAARHVLLSPVGSPYRRLQEDVPDASEDKCDIDAEFHCLRNGKGTTDIEAATAPESEEIHQKREDLLPDIRSRLASSEYTTFGEKLGFVTRDYIDPDDLALMTRQLVKHLESHCNPASGYAAFALVSLLTGCTDFLAEKLRFEPGDSIWLNIDEGSWCWAFSAYRSKQDDPYEPLTGEPISVPLPGNLACRLQHLRAVHPLTGSLGELITAELGSPLQLKQFREFLRTCGDAVHPPYASRFAKSMMFVYLHICGSDMAAAMLSGHFAVAAPAALFYYGPSYRLLLQRLNSTYSFLGFEHPAAIADPHQRAGCQKVLEEEQLQQGWARLTKAIGNSRSSIASTISGPDRVEEMNRLMVLLCAGFVIQTAHRGTRLERLTFGALFLHNDAILIADKDEGDRTHPRLIPKTAIVKEMLRTASAIHLMMNPTVVNGVHHDECLFVQWRDGQRQQVEPVTTGRLAKVIGEFFESAEYNFGRSAWVTHLDEDECDRWLIRVLTGHTRDVTRTNGAYFDIPPLIAAGKLAVSMERTGHRLFGLSALTKDQVDPLVLYRANGNARQTTTVSKMVPDPRSLLDPISVATLAGWRAITRLRFALTSGAIQTQPSALALLHMIAMDFVPDLDLCIAALQKPEQAIRIHGNTAGLLQSREHFIHPTWLPLLPTTTRLIAMAVADRPSRTTALDSIFAALHHIDPTYWPSSPEGCSSALVAAARAFLRLEFPPSLQAVSDPGVAAPTLNELSLMRLSDVCTTSSDIPPRKNPIQTRNSASNQLDRDLNSLKKIVLNNSSQTVRLGERRKRALICLGLR